MFEGSIKEKIINITNGDAFNEYFLSKLGGLAVPFREAMMDGNTVPEVYSNEFLSVRSAALNVSEEKYRQNMVAYDALNRDKYDYIQLWFGKDTFCQMNLLTLLAYLEQSGCISNVVLNYIEDETFEVIDDEIDVHLGIYNGLYNDILINKHLPDSLGVLIPKTIELYFDYHSDNGALAKLIEENADLDHDELVGLLLEKSEEYGLSDILAESLIEKYKK